METLDMAKLATLLSNPDEKIQDLAEAYKPILYALGNVVKDIFSDYVNNKEIYKLSAIGKRNQFDAYIEVGFTTEQAMALMLNDNLKLMKNLSDATKNVNQSQSKNK